MGKKSHSHKQRAVFLVALEKMTDDELDALGLAMPTTDPRFHAVYQEHLRRKPKQKQALIQELKDSAPASMGKQEVDELIADLFNPDLFQQFLKQASPEAKADYEQCLRGDEKALDQVITAINERHAALN